MSHRHNALQDVWGGCVSNKYFAKKITSGDATYASTKEYYSHCELMLLERAGKITDLQTQVPYELIPAQYESYERYGKNGKRLKDGKRCIERAVVYYADFVYRENGILVVEDTKSPATRTEAYIIKRKLMLQVHGIKIKET